MTWATSTDTDADDLARLVSSTTERFRVLVEAALRVRDQHAERVTALSALVAEKDAEIARLTRELDAARRPADTTPRDTEAP